MPSDATTPSIINHTTEPSTPHPWWKSAVIYQIYPISFSDSNGDGIGDLQGIRGKLDYLKDLGVDVIWLCPIYRSPLADMGYDISDYRDIDPRYGTLKDWDELLHDVHERGMKLVMDLVVNHSSDEHEWFVQSRSNKNDLKRDWYYWRPPRYDIDGTRQEPNNWRSVFQGSAWDYDEKTGEYYLHLYVSKQPDLNWDNPEVRNAVWDLMRFWLDRGCDGFRMDVINLISKVEGLPDAPITAPGEKYQLASTLFANGPRVHEYIREMNEKVLSNYDVMTVGETPFTHDECTLAEYGLPKNKELNMLFQFEIMDLDSPPEVPLKRRQWKLSELKSIIGKWQNFKRDEGFWNTVFIENHDHSRAVSRFGDDTTDEKRARTAKLLALLEICQGGTLYVYQGQELGLKNFPRTWGIEEYKDIASLNYWNKVKKQRQEEQGKEDVDMSDVLDDFAHKARDHARVPMQWDSTLHGGFTTGTPWMRVNDDYKEWNAAIQTKTENSVHGFWKRALAFRKRHDVLIYGDFEDVSIGNEQVFAFERSLGNTRVLVVLNFVDDEVEFELTDGRDWSGYKLLLGNYEEDDGLGRAVLHLRGYEGRVYLAV
ncbi:glycoside hydrolase family 13 protein [Amanita rubescens]|nr:glycoside hydrolase family 13 protein [Amanita rubescens]